MKVLMNSRMESRRGELVECVVCHVDSTLQKFGLNPDDAMRAATATADKLLEVFGGQILTFPTDYKKKLARKEADIFEQFNGANGYELAKAHGMTERGLRILLARVRARKPKGTTA